MEKLRGNNVLIYSLQVLVRMLLVVYPGYEMGAHCDLNPDQNERRWRDRTRIVDQGVSLF